MSNRPRLLSPYPGAKNPDRYPVHDGGDYDCWVAPFAGSGEQEAWIAQRYPGLAVIAADADPAVRAVWHCWADAELRRAVEKLIDDYSKRVEADPSKGFALLKLRIQQHWAGDYGSVENFAAVSILLRRLTFGGVIRRNADGELNVGLSQDKLNSFLAGWEFEWPAAPHRLNTFGDWSEAVDFVAGHGPDPCWNFDNAIAIVDPPYCAGTTDAYAQAGGELSMALDCVDLLLASGRVDRIVVFNYWGEWVEGEAVPREYPIVAEMQRLAQEYDTTAHFSHIGTLATMNKAGGKGAVHRFEGVWEIGGRRLYGSRPVVKPSSERVEQMVLAI